MLGWNYEFNKQEQTNSRFIWVQHKHFHQQRPANDQAYMNKDLEKILLTLGRLVGKADTGLGVVGAVTGDSDGASVIGFRVGASCFGLVSSFKRWAWWFCCECLQFCKIWVLVVGISSKQKQNKSTNRWQYSIIIGRIELFIYLYCLVTHPLPPNQQPKSTPHSHTPSLFAFALPASLIG